MLVRAWALGLVLTGLACSSEAETPYGPCQSNSVCSEETRRCIPFSGRETGFTLSLCTLACNTDTDCPEMGVCITADDENRSRFCVQRCTAATDCRFANARCATVRGTYGGCIP